jgi:hypothetical protein
LAAKAERAFYEVLVANQVAIPKAAIFTGHCSDEKVAPRIEISAHNGPEDPPRSGNYKLRVSITVVGSADIDIDPLLIEQPQAKDLHEVNVGTVFDVLAVAQVNDWLNRAVAEFFVFSWLAVEIDHHVEGRTFRDVVVLEVYCCGAAIVPEVPLKG